MLKYPKLVGNQEVLLVKRHFDLGSSVFGLCELVYLLRLIQTNQNRLENGAPGECKKIRNVFGFHVSNLFAKQYNINT